MRRFSASDRLANGRGSWKLRARPQRVRWCAGSPSSVSPAKRTLPVSLCKVPQMQLTRVDLPEPFGPIRPEPLALLHLEVDAVERDEAAEALAEPARPAAARVISLPL